MAALARTLYRARRHTTEVWGLLVAMVFWGFIAMGVFAGPGPWRGDLVPLTALAVFGVTLVRGLARELDPDPRAERKLAPAIRALRELEFGVLLATGVYVLLALTGGAQSFLHPLAYALVSFLMVIHRHRWVAFAWLGCIVVLEIAVARPGTPGFDIATVGYQLVMLGFFAAGNLLVLSSLVRRMRRDHTTRVDEELVRMRQEARDFRLIASQLPLESRARARDEEEARMAQGAVESIHEQLFHNMELLRTALGLNTCVLLWRGEGSDGEGPRATPKLAIKELATASEMARERPEIDNPGVLAAVLRDPKPLRLKALGGRRVPPYYAGPAPITDLCVIPLMHGASLRGLLCADRVEDHPFEDDEEEVLSRAGEHILRVIEHERVFAAVERGKYEQEQFYRASELLNQALTLEDVHQKTFAAIRAIVPYDLAVITAYDDGSGQHNVLSVDRTEREDAHRDFAELAEGLEGLSFGDGSGLVAMAVKNRHYMPATGELADPDAVVFTPGTRLRRAKSLLVLPLVRGDQVLGTIVLAAAAEGQFRPATREMLRVISHQVAVSQQNARMYQSMERRATTDGLTGLTNHRAFQERLSLLHALAERTGQKFSIILTDIDHFKSINDTYGHPVGDMVLKRVAAIFTGRARKVDIVARYGGEEFVLVLPDTDGDGATHFANKLREEIAAQVMTCDHGNFNITISMGVAEFPSDGTERQELIEKADQCLYYCKEHGRNQVHRWTPND